MSVISWFHILIFNMFIDITLQQYCMDYPNWKNIVSSGINIISCLIREIIGCYKKSMSNLWRKLLFHLKLKWGASFRWSFCPKSAWVSNDPSSSKLVVNNDKRKSFLILTFAFFKLKWIFIICLLTGYFFSWILITSSKINSTKVLSIQSKSKFQDSWNSSWNIIVQEILYWAEKKSTVRFG